LKKEEGKQFKRRVISEVLPSIRKISGYNMFDSYIEEDLDKMLELTINRTI
jgi:prophage antirepressor-like protein